MPNFRHHRCTILGFFIRLSAPSAPTVHAIYAQQLVERTVESQKDLLDVIFHVKPPTANQNYAIAAFTEKERGATSGADDMDVAATGKPVVEVQKDGVRIGVLLPLKSKEGKTIGTLGLVYKYIAGEDEHQFLLRSERIRNGLARQIPSLAHLFDEQVRL